MISLKKIYFSIPISIRAILQYIINKIDNRIVDDFINGNYGSEYGLTKKERNELIRRINKILKNINSASSIQSLTILLKQILSIPKDTKGVIVECGSYEGASTCVLSIAAKLINKKLIVYDSFEGLPEREVDKPRFYPHLSIYGYYKKGMYAASLKNVEKNLKLFGEIQSVEFKKGLFENTMLDHNEEICFIFMDVDLTSSTKTCIKYLWPHLLDNSYVYTDDSCDMEVVKVWFDQSWWKENLNQDPPGYIGGGCGIPVSGDFSSLGYSFKNVNTDNYKKVNWLEY